MSVALAYTDHYYSRDEYRRWYDAQPKGRFERFDGLIVAMAPERAAHVRVKIAAYIALNRAITAAGVKCEAWADGLSVECGDSDYEPDALVNCGAPITDGALSAPNPVIIVEVLSPSTASADTGAKLAGYFCVPSVRHYLIVHPTKRHVTHHRREGDSVNTRPLADGVIVMDPPGLTISLDEIYGAK